MIISTLTKARACILRTELHNVKKGTRKSHFLLRIKLISACMKSIGDSVIKLEIKK